MANNYLVLKFRNAKFFPSSRTNGFKIEKFIEPISANQISNVLHVLFGKRPVSSVRESYYNRENYLFSKAKDSYLCIDTPKLQKEGEAYHTEFMQLNKGQFNSWSTTLTLYWDKIEAVLGEELFNEFSDTIKKHFGFSRENSTFNEAIAPFRDLSNGMKEWEYGATNPIPVPMALHDDFLELFKKWRDTKNSALIFAVCDEKDVKLNSHKNSVITNTKGIADVTILSGTILVPVSEEDISNLFNSCATILDGGLVYIDSIVSGDELSDEGFIKVSEISTSKTEKYANQD